MTASSHPVILCSTLLFPLVACLACGNDNRLKTYPASGTVAFQDGSALDCERITSFNTITTRVGMSRSKHQATSSIRILHFVMSIQPSTRHSCSPAGEPLSSFAMTKTY